MCNQCLLTDPHSGAVALAEYLAESPQIQQLDLRGNEVRLGGLMALCLALRINLSLATLDLDSTPTHQQVSPCTGQTLRSSLVSQIRLYITNLIINNLKIYILIILNLIAEQRFSLSFVPSFRPIILLEDGICKLENTKHSEDFSGEGRDMLSGQPRS